ncbi:TraR/DksA family transcriptional regulator [Geodermatophilus sabuli]|uniref:Transcriptional regulator, TraR/DksA family n=1 Tax=Geodermatophilus sabuli TaxID=1564158 RepID=A0A285E8X4_9ACTN|nr:TraR/DksA C4-type zinc finger protein [Geodermatophilus sabuli]MBB3082586.1 DnaK suppressor protein [Geodermatophilus sabuli]SNX94546.1 transcriptional regulator, TraR/DksA family [Geodermatophilus sabuli]
MTSTIPAPVPATGDSQWEPFRLRLEAQRAECVQERERALADTVQSLPDDVAVSRAASLLQTIEDIDAALARIAAGSYGRCVHCGTDIPEERLELRPFATGCVACSQRR